METSKQYCDSVPLTVEAFKNRRCSLPACHPDYVQPTPDDVRALRVLLGFSREELSKFANVKLSNKGSGAVRKWETPIGSSEHHHINYGVWRMMLYAAGVASVDDDLREVRLWSMID
ncbi:hypothetical protein [Shewanella algae]|uniref:hypothetical protein n=1 Tax=Shewanella algae TaxID=38313 RepID=UPI0031F572E9